jgi:hypothetical protein
MLPTDHPPVLFMFTTGETQNQMAKPPFLDPKLGPLPRGMIGEPLAGFSTLNMREAMLDRVAREIENRSFGANNLKAALSAAKAQSTSSQQVETKKPVEPQKK